MRRLIDPTGQATRHVAERLGHTPQSEIVSGIDGKQADAGDTGPALFQGKRRIADAAEEVAFDDTVFALSKNGRRSSVGINTNAVPLKTDTLDVFAPTTSAQLAALLTDETGSGKAVFGTLPTITIRDTELFVADNGDLTKLAQFDASKIGTGTTNAYTLPSAAGRLPVLSNEYVTPPGPVVIDAATVTALATQQCGARYLGMAPADCTGVEVTVRVTTAVATITYAEIGIASANSATGGTLTRITTADVSASYNSTGNKTNTLSAAIAAGTYVYFIFGSQATTPFQLRGTLPDELGLGLVRLASTTRPSTMAATAFSTSTNSTGAAWVIFRWL